MLTKAELIWAELRTALQVKPPVLIQKALALDFSKFDTNIKGSLTIAELKVELGSLATRAEH